MTPSADHPFPRSRPVPPGSSSPAPRDAASATANAGTVAGMGKATATLVAVAATATVAAGGWAGGRLHNGEPVWPFGGAEAPPPEETEPEPDRIEYRDLSIALPEEWTSELVEEEFGVFSDPDGAHTTEQWLVLHPTGQEGCDGVDWSYTDNSVDCRHIKVLGPAGIEHGGEGYAAMTRSGAAGGPYSFSPSSNPMPCPVGAPTHPRDPERAGQWDRGTRDVGDVEAAYAEGYSTCVETGEGAGATTELLHHEQRLWLLEERGVLVVDNYGIDAFDAVLADAELPG